MEYTIEHIATLLQSAMPNVTTDIPTNCHVNVAHLLIDSRSLLDADTTLFFALKSSRNDGHKYIAQLYNRGVRAFVVSDQFNTRHEYPLAAFIIVDNPAKALQTLATQHRSQFHIPVIAITGSRGKTIVKEWLFQLLAPQHSVARSPRSYNSSLGVPLSLWQIDAKSQLALIEAGISRKGEMETLRQMINPDITVLTDIGTPHDDGFSSRQEKIAEKLILARNSHTLIYPASDPDIAQAVQKAIADGMLRADIRLIDSTTYATETSKANQHFQQPWQINNLSTCITTLQALGCNNQEILAGISTLRPIGTRLYVRDGVNKCLVVADDYTCDLHSLLPALDFVARRATANRSLTLILSNMSHETSTPEETYSQTARLCSLRHVSKIIGIGTEISSFAHLFPQDSRFFNSTNEALAQLSPSDFNQELILVKGTPDSGLAPLTQMLEARTHETVLEVNLDALVSNLNFYRSHLKPTTGVVAMVKASGYGAGSYELAKTLQGCGASYLAVAVLDEGIDLRNAGITMPIMVLNPKVLNYPLLFANKLEPEIFDFDILNEIIAEARKFGVHDYPIHIKLDTGMHRLGFLEDDIDRVIDIISHQDNICISSVFSHLATADCPTMNDYTEMQLATFHRGSTKIVESFPYRIKRHILNTAGIIRYPQYQYDMVRLGIGLYGVPVLNDGSEKPLRQVSTLSTPIISIKEWNEGTTIGYGRRGLLHRTSRIATIPIGYADGINRHMGCGHVNFIVNGIKCPTVGNICMDICMIDVTDVPDVKVGDTVEIFGENNPVTELSTPLNTIPYEILTSISPRVPRLYFSE